MTFTVSAQFAATVETPEHIAFAESLGYRRAWVFDTPHQSPDVWMTLTRAAAMTTRIGLGPGVLVPILRHPMVNAAATATLAAQAPGRVAVAFGTGFAGARALGLTPASWDYLRDYVAVFRALLSGEDAHWNDATLHMADALTPSSSRQVPVLISAIGPKGLAVAAALADGLFSVNGETRHAPEFDWAALAVHGTVLADGEALDSERVRDTAGPGNALAYHATYEHGGDVTALPGGQAWLDVITAVPASHRHLAVHDQHLTALNTADHAAWAAGAWRPARYDVDGHRHSGRRQVDRARRAGNHRSRLSADRPRDRPGTRDLPRRRRVRRRRSQRCPRRHPAWNEPLDRSVHICTLSRQTGLLTQEIS